MAGVGASAGGIEAFTQLLKATPPDLGMAFVFVLHMGNQQKSALSEILARATRMPVAEVNGRTPVRPNCVYVITPGTDLVLENGELVPVPRSVETPHFKGIDHFFRSLAEHQGHRAIGIVLSGTASDGSLGIESIKAEGGITFAQDSSAQHEGMPRAAIASNTVDYVLAPEEIGRELGRIAGHPYVAGADL